MKRLFLVLYRITNTGLQVGEPLRNFQGVLRGVPTLTQDPAPLDIDPP